MSASPAQSYTNGGSGSHNHSGHEQTTIDRILQCAVALNWKSLTADETTAMQIEYRTGPRQSLECVKLWSSTSRGYWNLLCEYWMLSSSAHESGTTFTSGKPSAEFAWMMDAVMQHQREFTSTSNGFVDGLVQISPPTEADMASAQEDMTEALDRIGSLEPKK
jgi:hypothetical protein